VTDNQCTSRIIACLAHADDGQAGRQTSLRACKLVCNPYVHGVEIKTQFVWHYV